ncbi:MAG: DUF4300 family protein [Roseburia faecis]
MHKKSMSIVKEYNDTIQNTSLVKEGYASFDMTMPEYDIDAIQDLWMKKKIRTLSDTIAGSLHLD